MKYKPLPEFGRITWEKVSPLSLILEVGSNKLTEWGEHAMGWEYDKVYTHAMNKIMGNDILSMGFNANIIKVDKLSKSHLFTVISYNDLTQAQIANGIEWCYKYVKNNKLKYYDVMGYLAFFSRIYPKLGKIKWLHGSNKLMFCSDLEVHLYKSINYKLYIETNSEKVSPCDLFTLNSKWDKAYFHTLII